MKKNYGQNNQVRFADEHEYYRFLGYLAKSDGSTKIVYEHNELQGAWASENRIQFFVDPPMQIISNVSLTAGVGNIKYRVNCNDFLQEIINLHGFMNGKNQNLSIIRKTIPPAYIQDFNNGLNL
jgi:hypothetical protein